MYVTYKEPQYGDSYSVRILPARYAQIVAKAQENKSWDPSRTGPPLKNQNDHGRDSTGAGKSR